MPILQDANTQDLKRLLEVFPVAALKEGWPSIRGDKSEICFGAAQEHDVKRIIDFIATNISRCKQHVYVLSKPEEQFDAIGAFPDSEIIDLRNNNEYLVVVRARFEILLKDPLEQQSMDFLWPMRIDDTGNQLIVRFVVMERNPCAYFERDCYISERNVEERDIVAALEQKGFCRVDLHKGIKTLWQEDFMDSWRIKYKKPKSQAAETMDDAKGIKQHNPELYEEAQESTLFTMQFIIPPGTGCAVEVFNVDPSAGFLSFPRYTEDVGGTDDVVRKILEKNT
jgi:hypothetical protein